MRSPATNTSPTPTVPILDLHLQNEPLRAEILEALDGVLSSSGFANGPAVAQFENDFADYLGVSSCVAVSTGTSALHVAMSCLDIGPGDEVITVSMSFVATAWPIIYLRAKPVFVDIEPGRYTMDPSALAAAITPNTKAIVVVHLYGQCAEMDPILKIADAHGIPVIEDCAQAHGAVYKGRRAGAMGTMGCFSFYPSKNLGACGEGGAISTNDDEIAERARRLRDHGQQERYRHVEMGYNYRMDGFQGAILSIKLKHLDRWTDGRARVVQEYDTQLSGCDVTTPAPCPDGRHVHHLYVVRDRHRDDLRQHLQTQRISTGLHYPIPIHLQDPFEQFGYKKGDFPVTESLGDECLSLPLYAELTEDQVRHVVDAIRNVRG